MSISLLNPDGVPPGLQVSNNPMYANPTAARKTVYDVNATGAFFGVIIKATAATTVNVSFYAKNNVPPGPGSPPVAAMTQLDARNGVSLAAGSSLVWMDSFRQMIDAGSVDPRTVIKVVVQEVGGTAKATFTRLSPNLDGCG